MPDFTVTHKGNNLRISFSCTSCTICKHGRVVCVEYSFDQELRGFLENLVLTTLFVECIVKGVLFFLRSVLSECTFFMHKLLRIHKNNDRPHFTKQFSKNIINISFCISTLPL